MVQLVVVASFLTLIYTVSCSAILRVDPPKGWDSVHLEPYGMYHTRYLALSCQSKHATPFFDLCCHPLLATEKLEVVRPSLCNPEPTLPDNDADLPYCDEIDDEQLVSSLPTAVLGSGAHQPSNSTRLVPIIALAAAGAASAEATVYKGGFATYYFQNGVAGACGKVNSDTAMIAAIDGDRYGNLGKKSALCGKKVKLTNTRNGKSVTVTIADACPTCKNSNSIDLSVSAFKKIATLDQGIVPITWSYV